MDNLSTSWSAFSQDIAEKYLVTFGHPSTSSKKLLADVIRQEAKNRRVSMVDIGCGNANLYAYLQQQKMDLEYTGIDFSTPLVEAATKKYPEINMITDDVNTLNSTPERKYDIAIYSHVIEMLASPEQSLKRAKRLAKTIIIRFFEPPVFESDTVELQMMDVGNETKVPYIRRKMSRDYYRLILTKMNIREVRVYKDENSKDEIHVLLY